MQSQTLISIIVFWVAVLSFTIAGSDDDYSITDQSKTLEIVNKLNTLVRHSGWRSMDNVKVNKMKNHRKVIEDPMSAILEAVSSERNPVNEFNAMMKYEDVFSVLKCKYAEVMLKCRILIQRVMRVCRIERLREGKKTSNNRRYYDCFRLLLVKLHSITPRFKCMADALNFMYSLGPQNKPKSRMIVAAEKLTEYTSTVGPNTSAKFFEHDNNDDVIDIEMKNINEYIMSVYSENIYRLANYHCNGPPQEEWTALRLIEDFEYKKGSQQIPEAWTMVQYVIDEMDCYISDILDSCFYNLGFAHDLTGNVIIRNI